MDSESIPLCKTEGRPIQDETRVKGIRWTTCSLIMRRTFIQWITLFRQLDRHSQPSFKLGNLFTGRFEVVLYSQQYRMHLCEFIFQMSDVHFEIDQSLRKVFHGRSKVFKEF